MEGAGTIQPKTARRGKSVDHRSRWTKCRTRGLPREYRSLAMEWFWRPCSTHVVRGWGQGLDQIHPRITIVNYRPP